MTFLRTTAFEASDADPTSLTRLRADELQAVVIRNVLTLAECRAIVADLESNAHAFPQTSFPSPFRSHFYGMNLNLAEPSLAGYFAMAPRFAASLQGLMSPLGGFEGRITDLLSRCDEGCCYRAPPGPPGRPSYMVTTLRSHHEGGYIPPHFDNEQRSRPSYRHLASLIDGDIFSFVLTLSRAERGGMLEVFDAESDAWGARFQNRDGGSRPDLSDFRSHSFDVAPGTVVVLRSGRHLHRVTPVVGASRRWTACSFMAAARAPGHVACWG